ncbi:hypothetical protein GOBAR_DD33314 [Gossypium barbadense]|nr:hypothetical protein GOBAR_DD33314 [Gossypium barbadense]
MAPFRSAGHGSLDETFGELGWWSLAYGVLVSLGGCGGLILFGGLGRCIVPSVVASMAYPSGFAWGNLQNNVSVSFQPSARVFNPFSIYVNDASLMVDPTGGLALHGTSLVSSIPPTKDPQIGSHSFGCSGTSRPHN